MPNKGEAIPKGTSSDVDLDTLIDGAGAALRVERGELEYYGLTAEETAAKIAEAKAALAERVRKECKAARGFCVSCQLWLGDLTGEPMRLFDGTPLCAVANEYTKAWKIVNAKHERLLSARAELDGSKRRHAAYVADAEESAEVVKENEAKVANLENELATATDAVAALDGDAPKAKARAKALAKGGKAHA